MPRFVPVEAKLTPPTARDDLVLRERIVERLLDLAHRPVVLVTAPPGFGKTVVVAQWAATDPRPFAWYSLDRADDDPWVFLTYVANAMQRIGVVTARAAARIGGDDPDGGAAAAERLGRLLAASPTPFVLVLDGTDALRSRAVWDVVTRLVDHLPTGSQLVLIGRAAPAMAWAALRSDDRLLEVSADDLRLTGEEALSLVRLAGADRPPEVVEVLLEKTEGWAAGMYLAVAGARSGDGDEDGDNVGSDSVVADYLMDEIFRHLSTADQAFVRRCSILTSLSAPLCDAVLGTRGSATALRRLARENIVTPDGDRPGWYKIHPLFAEAMLAELARQEPKLVESLHARASTWLERADELDEAIPHAIIAGDVDRSARLIWRRTAVCLGRGRIDTVEGWLASFTRQQVVSQSKLAASAAACALARGLPADHWISAAERGRYDAARQGESASVAGAVALLNAMVARNGVVQMGADARLALSLSVDEPEWTCTAELLDCVSAYLVADATDARRRLEGVEQHAAAQNDRVVQVAALAELAWLAIGDDDWTGAAECIDNASRLMREHALHEMSRLVLVPCVAALVAAHTGRRDSAETQVRSCGRALANVVELPPWLGVQCRQALARAHLRLGDVAATRLLLSEAQTLLGRPPRPVVLDESVQWVWQQVEQLPVGVPRGTPPLTTAELRVLQWLPTYLSFEEIGRQLFVSRNTVKTQAIATYRTLGVTSRAEAVECAHRLGLINR
jgi:LuxR family maltose regulon positive regulatory protein